MPSISELVPGQNFYIHNYNTGNLIIQINAADANIFFSTSVVPPAPVGSARTVIITPGQCATILYYPTTITTLGSAIVFWILSRS
jgi:hypothetical protein